MFRFKSPNLLAFIFLPLVVFGAACYSNESNSRWANAQRESTQGANPAATTTDPAQTQNAPNRPPRSSKPLAGGEFNKFFPAANESGYTRVASNLKRYIDITDNKLDYVSAFLDMTTNYYEHTGVQTLARRLTERAVAEI